MIPILFKAEAEPDALIDANSEDLQDVNSVDLLASDDKTLTRSFSDYGIGSLSDCISCEVTEERNGEYELAMEYPVTGKHYDEIELRCIVLAKPNYTDNAQAFRIYTISTPIDGVVQIQARHIVYDLSGVPVVPFTATSCSDACAKLTSNAAIETPFTVNTQIGTIADFAVDAPSSVRSWFGGKEGSLIDVYGGEWAYDNYTATLKSARGADRGVVIRYGKNLVDFNQEENCENTWTGVLPFWTNEEGTVVHSNISNVAGSYDYRRILCLDCSADFEEEPTTGQLTAKAQKYITANDIGIPKVNITLDYVQVSELTDRVDLCDTVKVVFERIGVETSAKCIRTVWDVLKDRYSSVEFGDVNPDITDTIATLEADTEKAKVSVSATMLNAIATATALITGNSGGYVVMRDSDNDGYPDEILIMDTADIDTATKVWRWNQSGLGYSASGYNGTYGLAITQNGAIVADFITTGTLDASQVNVENLDASNITTGTLDANVVTVANIDASNITTGTINAIDISGSTITGGTLTGTTINNGSGTFVVDTSGNVTANSLTSSNATITGGSMAISNLSDNYSVITLDGSNFNSTIKSGSFRIDRSDGTGYVSISPLFFHIEHNGDSAVVGPVIGVTTTNAVAVNKNVNGTTYPGGSMYADGSGTSYNLKLQATNQLVLDAGSGKYIMAPPIYNQTTTAAANVYVAWTGAMGRSTSSSKRYKHDITDKLGEDPDALYGVPVVQFRYNNDYLNEDDQRYGKDIIGFIAEDVAEAMPGAVDYDDEGRPEMWNVHVIVPAMMELIKRQKHSIDELQAQVTDLTARLDRLEARFSDDGR